MDDCSDLDCRIFVDAGQTRDGVVALLVEALTDAVEGRPAGRSIASRHGELEIRRNKEADKARASHFPDGFLFFPYTLEFYPRSMTRREDRVSVAATILNFLWDRGLPAVAVCDYEGELPKGGGYKDRSIPWPSKPVELQEPTGPNGSPAVRSAGSASADKPSVVD